MSELIDGDDGLPLENDVGDWAVDKYRVLVRYLNLQAGPRSGFLGPDKGQACYIDLFCGPGRASIKNSGRYVDGSPVVAWRASVKEDAPFSALYIADKDAVRREACAERLRRLNAPVIVVGGDAAMAARWIAEHVPSYGLHFAFLDPYSLGELRFEILKTLASVRRMDIMVHLSAMDLFRNLDRNIARERREFDAFAPGYHEHVSVKLPRAEMRRAVIEYWKGLVSGLRMDAGTEMHRVQNLKNRDLYWLLLLSKHELARKFWKIALKSEPQRSLDL